MEYYASKHHQMEKLVGVIHISFFGSIIYLRSHSWNCGSVIYMLILIFTSLSSLIYKYFMPPFGSIRYLRLHNWNCGSVISMILLILPRIFSLIDKDFMLTLGSIRFLRFHKWNCGKVMFMIFLILPTLSLSYIHSSIYLGTGF